jgi:2,3-bisphosphoglycerate-dependent phosphoglycerate mutase
MRHGESQYNVLKKFAGWLDCELTDEGMAQARRAGRILRSHGYAFDLAYSSMLKRAANTLRIVLDEMDMFSVPCQRSWRLNERHYGGFDGLTLEEAQATFGQETIRLCRENFEFRPPVSKETHLGSTNRTSQTSIVPECESMRDASERCQAFWSDVIKPEVSTGSRVLVVAHGEILRLLTGRLIGMSESEIVRAPVIPNATPWVFELGDDLQVCNHRLLTEVKTATSAVDAL